MANAKNTIQNISLTGKLCLNKLKTDVKQFEGYNEKNSTVFGGELTPYNRQHTAITGHVGEAYTIYNNKGHGFTVTRDMIHANNAFELWSEQTWSKIGGTNNTFCPLTLELELPGDAVWGCMLVPYNNILMQIYVSNDDGRLYYRMIHFGEPTQGHLPWADGELQEAIKSIQWQRLGDFRLSNWSASGSFFTAGTGDCVNGQILLVFVYGSTGIISSYNGQVTIGTFSVNEDGTITTPVTNSIGGGALGGIASTAMVTLHHTATEREVYLINAESEIGIDEWLPPSELPDAADFEIISFIYENGAWTRNLQNTVYHPMAVSENDNEGFIVGKGQYTSFDVTEKVTGTTKRTYVVSPYSLTKCCFDGDVERPALYKTICANNENEARQWNASGHDGQGFLNRYDDAGNFAIKRYDFTTLRGNLIAVTYAGIPVTAPTSMSSNYITISKISGCHCINYSSNNKQYCCVIADANAMEMFVKDKNLVDVIKNGMIIDNRYVLLLDDIPMNTKMFDLESENYVANAGYIGFISTTVPFHMCTTSNPVAEIADLPTTGAIYMSGFNAGYAQSNAQLIGYLPNPFESSYNIVGTPYMVYSNNSIQEYYSTGDSVQSAEYYGKSPLYVNTTYPIDVNGNVVFPITLNSTFIKGYANNDMVKINNVAYPLMYYNNNLKIYAYTLLSSMEGIDGIFTLQGRQYTFDNNNIYSVTFNNGVISNVEAVCYKKNMQYIGTLPTAAIFYSTFNKTFYQFTGDAIMSKMFEANDIDEIYFVGQNPSTLSLWMCTDKGIYVMSDTDMHRLNYVSHSVFFNNNNAMVIYDAEAEHHPEYMERYNDILSLYKQSENSEEIPIKLATKYYGLGGELKAGYDCWYIRLHSDECKNGKLKIKVNTITDKSFETEEKTYEITKSKYDANHQVYIKYQPKYQSAVATQLELESDIAIYQISLGVNQTDTVTQQAKFNF